MIGTDVGTMYRNGQTRAGQDLLWTWDTDNGVITRHRMDNTQGLLDSFVQLR